MRPAVIDDSPLLLAWHNDEGTRCWSRSGVRTDDAAHTDWLASSIENDARIILLGEDGIGPVGTVRWDHSVAGWEVSITVAPERRGERLAGPLLRAGEEALRDRTSAGTPVTAVVHFANTASARLFAQAGYIDDGSGPDADGYLTLRRPL